MYEWIIEADIYRYRQALRDASSEPERVMYRGLLARAERRLSAAESRAKLGPTLLRQ